LHYEHKDYTNCIIGHGPIVCVYRVCTAGDHYEDNSFVILSQNPYASCFFCGQSGPETVMEIEVDPSDKTKYELDERATFKGILTFNADDVNHLTYILKNATRVE